jgi:hypothetical protein
MDRKIKHFTAEIAETAETAEKKWRKEQRKE